MANTPTVEFGRPDERENFINTHQGFFERLPNLQKALHVAFLRERAPFNIADTLISALSKLCVEDFSEILLLCSNGFGNGAMKSLRGMYEKLVNARYLRLYPDMAETFWDYHVVKLSKMGGGDILEKYDPDGRILDSFKVSRTGGKQRLKSSWSDLDFVQMAVEVGLGAFINKAYRMPLEFAHPSVTAILPMLESEGKGITIKEIEPQRDIADDASRLAYLFVLEVLRLQVEHFDLHDPIFKQCMNDSMYTLGREDSPSELKSS